MVLPMLPSHHPLGWVCPQGLTVFNTGIGISMKGWQRARGPGGATQSGKGYQLRSDLLGAVAITSRHG